MKNHIVVLTLLFCTSAFAHYAHFWTTGQKIGNAPVEHTTLAIPGSNVVISADHCYLNDPQGHGWVRVIDTGNSVPLALSVCRMAQQYRFAPGCSVGSGATACSGVDRVSSCSMPDGKNVQCN